MVALELDGDRLAERIVDERVLDAPADGLDELEELVGLPFGLADDEDVGEDVIVALVQLIEEHVGSMVRQDRAAKYTTGSPIDPLGGGR
jgi:hypothetical protein